MTNDLKSEILNACRGYERDHIINTLKEIVCENSPQQLREMYNMKPCPKCGSTDVYITNVMHGVCEGHPKVIAKVGFCTTCRFHSAKVYSRDLKPCYTEASWTIETVRIWNNTRVTSIFSICEELFGKDYQYALNSEEVFELIDALIHYGKTTARDCRFDRRQDDDVIISEMADVIICIFQLLHTRHIPPYVLNAVMGNKLKRLCVTESVRTAILELSNNVIQATSVNVHTVDAPNSINTEEI